MLNDVHVFALQFSQAENQMVGLDSMFVTKSLLEVFLSWIFVRKAPSMRRRFTDWQRLQS